MPLSAEQAPGAEQFATEVWARHTGLADGFAIEEVKDEDCA